MWKRLAGRLAIRRRRRRSTTAVTNTQENISPPSMTRQTPLNIGILAIEGYFPNAYISQSELERNDGVSSGKYTAGLGQEAMAIIQDNEDVNSMCMTVVMQLLERHKIDPNQIGRIEVGTETIQDKSKSIKSYLMQLFPFNSDICGVDNVNACYGGTAALLNSVAWMESGDWDGRLALVVAGDVAIYSKGPARPTGGAGAVAILLGPNAPVIIERGTASHYMQHTFDFYKPNPTSEYPIVDGQSSIACYLKALDACYTGHLDRIEHKMGMEEEEEVTLDNFDYFVFHSPYGKLVQKSLGRLMFMDALRNVDRHPELQPYREAVPETTYSSRELDQAISRLSGSVYDRKTAPSRLIPVNIGNSYCASLYLGLVSLLSSLSGDCVGKRIGMFSYGSGLAATMFSLIIVGDYSRSSPSRETIQKLLSQRHAVDAVTFETILKEREVQYCASGWTPKTSLTTLRPGTYYLVQVDNLFRRYYDRFFPLA